MKEVLETRKHFVTSADVRTRNQAGSKLQVEVNIEGKSSCQSSELGLVHHVTRLFQNSECTFPRSLTLRYLIPSLQSQSPSSLHRHEAHLAHALRWERSTGHEARPVCPPRSNLQSLQIISTSVPIHIHIHIHISVSINLNTLPNSHIPSYPIPIPIPIPRISLTIPSPQPSRFLGNWGNIGSQPQKGITSYALSANRQRPLAGTAHAAVFNSWRRFRTQVLYWAPPMLFFYALMNWAVDK